MNNLLINRNGSTIEGANTNVNVTYSNREYSFVYLNADWKIFSKNIVPGVTTERYLTGPIAGNEGTKISLQITGWNGSDEYNITPSGGSFVRSYDEIVWTLPTVTSNADHTLTLELVGGGTYIHNVTVFNVTSTADTNISVSNFNASSSNDGWTVENNAMTSSTSSAVWISEEFAQGNGETGWREYATELTGAGISSLAESAAYGKHIVANTALSNTAVLSRFSNNDIASVTINSPYHVDWNSVLQTANLNSGTWANVYKNYATFNPDGTKIYYIDRSSTVDYIRNQNLSTPYDTNTAGGELGSIRFTYSNGSAPSGPITWAPDGSKFFYVANTGPADSYVIRQYDTPTAWEPSSASNTQYTVLNDTRPTHPILGGRISFTSDGLKMCVIGESTQETESQSYGAIYTLANPYDITTDYQAVINNSELLPGRFGGWTRGANGFMTPDGYKIIHTAGEYIYVTHLMERASFRSGFRQDSIRAWEFGGDQNEFLTRPSMLEYVESQNKLYITDGQARYVKVCDVPKIAAYNRDNYEIPPMTVASIDIESERDSDLTSFAIKPDGTKLYIADGGDIRQYSLTTPWVLTTKSTVEAVNNTFGQQADDITFNNDGTKIYVADRLIGVGDSTLYEYDLSIAWDIASMVLAGSKLLSGAATETGDIQAVLFNADGSKMFTAACDEGDLGANGIFVWDLSTPWSVNTATYTGDWGMTLGGDAGNWISSMSFAGDGEYFIVGSHEAQELKTYALTTPYDFSTGSRTELETYNYHTNYDTINKIIMQYSPDAQKSYQMLALVGNEIKNMEFYDYPFEDVSYLYTTDDPRSADIEAYYSPFPEIKALITQDRDALDVIDGSVTISSSNNTSATVDFDNDIDTVFSQNDNITLTFASYTANVATSTLGANTTVVDVASKDSDPVAIAYSSNGRKMYMLGETNNRIYQYSLSTAFDQSTVSDDSIDFDITSNDQNPRGMTFSPDGTKIFVLGDQTDVVYEYDMSTAWDISSATYTSEISISGTGTSPTGMFFNATGSKMYILDAGSIFQYDLGTAWSANTATYTAAQNISVSDEDAVANGAEMSQGGEKLFVIGGVTDKVYQYTLSTPEDITTATYDGASNDLTVGAGSSANDIVLSRDGSKLYVLLGSAIDSIYEDDTGITVPTAQTQIQNISVSGGKTELTYGAQDSSNITKLEYESSTAFLPWTSYSYNPANGQVTASSNNQALPNQKYFAKFAVESNEIGQGAVNAKIILWKQST